MIAQICYTLLAVITLNNFKVICRVKYELKGVRITLVSFDVNAVEPEYEFNAEVHFVYSFYLNFVGEIK